MKMRYRILGENKKEPDPPEEYLVKDYENWRCGKCEIIYGPGENILIGTSGEDKDIHYCPVHSKEHIYTAEIEYWQDKYVLKAEEGGEDKEG